jgi:hypothetical protein
VAAANGRLLPNPLVISTSGRIANGLGRLANSTVTEPSLPVPRVNTTSRHADFDFGFGFGFNFSCGKHLPKNPKPTHMVTYSPNSIQDLQKYRALLKNGAREAGIRSSATRVHLDSFVNTSVHAPGLFGSYNLSTFMRRNLELLPDQASATSINAVLTALAEEDMVCFLYVFDPAPTRSDVWPDTRDESKLPVKLTPIYCTSKRTEGIDFAIINGKPVEFGRGHRSARARKSPSKKTTLVRIHFDAIQNPLRQNHHD